MQAEFIPACCYWGAMSVVTSSLIVSLVDHVTAPARAVSRAIIGLTEQQTRVSRSLGEMRGKMVEAVGVGYGLAHAISAPIKAATEFQSQLIDIFKAGDLPLNTLASLGKQFEHLGVQTNQTTKDIASSAQLLVATGMDVVTTVKLLPIVGRTATAMGADLLDITNLAYSASENLKVPVDQLGATMDAASAAGQAGHFELRDMAQYIPTLSASYQSLGQTGVKALADISAAMQVSLKDTGAGNYSTAANNFNDLFLKMNASETRKKFAEMGTDLEASMKSAARKGMNPMEAIADVTRQTLMKKGFKKGDLSHLGDLFHPT